MIAIPPRLRFPLAVLALGLLALGGFFALRSFGPQGGPNSDPVGSTENRKRPDAGPKGTDARYRLESLLIEGGERDKILKSIHEICAEMNEADLEQVFSLLSGVTPGELSVRSWRLYANEIMGRLVDEELEGLSPKFLSLALDENALPVIRDYSVQYFIGASRKKLLEAPRDDSANRQESLSVILEGAKTLLDSEGVVSTTIYGTTLMGLSSVAGDLTGEELETLRKTMAPMILPEVTGTADSGMAAKISAIQAAARLGIEEAGPLIAGIACDPKAEFQRRLSALGALREYPDQAPVDQLKRLAKKDRKLRFAAQSTLDYLENRSPNSSGK